MQGKENRPTWAMTPNLAVALNAQRSQRAEDVFGKVQPIKLEGKKLLIAFEMFLMVF